LKNPAQKLRDKTLYRRSDVKISGGKAVPANGYADTSDLDVRKKAKPR
jgi:hypothetical protein